MRVSRPFVKHSEHEKTLISRGFAILSRSFQRAADRNPTMWIYQRLRTILLTICQLSQLDTAF